MVYHEGSACSRSHNSRTSEATVPRNKDHKIVWLIGEKSKYTQENWTYRLTNSKSTQ